MSASVAAYLFTLLIAVVALFQLALAAGAPWSSLAMGGRFPGKMPPPMRIAAFLQIGVLALFAATVLTRAGLILPEWQSLSHKMIWVVVGFSVIGSVLNLITPSRWERILWAPVAILLLIFSAIVAFS